MYAPTIIKSLVCACLITLTWIVQGSSQTPVPDHNVPSDPGLRLEKITTRDGLSMDNATAILKDSRGFIWIGTTRGLNRYDGYGFRKFYKRENDEHFLSDDYILSLYEDRSGMIWIGTLYGGIHRFDPSNETFTRYPSKTEDKYGIRTAQVFSISQGPEGNIWFAAHLPELQSVYRLRPETGQVNCVVEDPENPGSPLQIHSHYLTCGRDGTMWVGYEKGVLKYDASSSSFSDYQLGAFKNYRYSREVFVIHEDIEGRLWTGSFGGGLYQLDKTTGKFTRMNPEGEHPETNMSLIYMGVAEDDQGTLYFRTMKGIQILDQKTGKSSIINPGNRIIGAGYMFQKGICWDPSGILWFSMAAEAGADTPGVYKLTRDRKKFTNYTREQLNIPEGTNTWISSICEDQVGNLWIGGNPIGLIRKQGVAPGAGIDRLYPEFSCISALYQDAGGTMWTGDWYTGSLYRLDPEGSRRIDSDSIERSQTYRNAPYKPGDEFLNYADYRFSGAGSMRIIELGNGSLLIGKGTGLELYDPDTKILRKINLCPDSVEYHDLPVVSSLEKDQDGTIWIGTMHLGLFKLTPPFDSTESGYAVPRELKSYRMETNTYPEFRDLMITSLCIPRHNLQVSLWIGTLGGGLFCLKENRFIQLTSDEGLPSDNVYGIQEDRRGDLWLSTENGLSRYRMAAGLFRNFGPDDGVRVLRFYWLSSYKSKNGRIYFGGSEGLLAFHPDSVVDNPVVPPVVITAINLFNEPMEINKDTPLKRSVLFATELDLSFRENYLSFEFASLNFIEPLKNRYRYRLEGVDREWIEAGTSRTASYPNLRHGRYTFRVTGSNNDGIWNMEGDSLLIHIHPPPWLSWWAYCLYILLSIGLILWYRSFLLSRGRLKTAFELEKLEKEKALELDEMKSRFFANISHEFRTPLTLILEPVNKLLKDQGKSRDRESTLLVTIKRNALRLKQLINQLLDLSRLETGKMDLKVKEGNLAGFIQNLASSFSSQAENKGIIYKLSLDRNPSGIFFDGDKVEKIAMNLISNAIKFTPANGTVDVALSYIHKDGPLRGTWVHIEVRDSGPGIPQEHQEKIFNRFYQVDSSNTGAPEGTGIGLSLVKELIRVYRGSITLNSTPGAGSTFSVELPVSNDLFEDEEMVATKPAYERNGVVPDIEPAEVLSAPGDMNERESGRPDPKHDAGTILIVEDNRDLRMFMAQTLSEEFLILEAENGSEGLDKALDTIPDLVISDLMMPVLDGIGMCEKLRTDQRTSHIPVVMLTARADRESKIESLDKGADDYLLKPFDAEELVIRVRNLIEQRKRIREKYRREILSGTLDVEPDSEKDPFISILLARIDQNMKNEAFGVEELGRMMGLSRTQLYRKTMAIICMSPSELIRSSRLKQAARMFRNGHRNVTQVMFEVGFSHASNFAAAFRSVYGKNPKEFARERIKAGK